MHSLVFRLVVVRHRYDPTEPGANRIAMLGRYAIQLVPLMAGAGALHSAVMCTARDNGTSLIAAHAMGGCVSGALVGGATFVSINGVIGGCMLLGGTAGASQLYKHARGVPGERRTHVENIKAPEGLDGSSRV